ncbi:MAG: hypothetical protein ABW185_28125 [Sedimenticola sp.]
MSPSRRFLWNRRGAVPAKYGLHEQLELAEPGWWAFPGTGFPSPQ